MAVLRSSSDWPWLESCPARPPSRRIGTAESDSPGRHQCDRALSKPIEKDTERKEVRNWVKRGVENQMGAMSEEYGIRFENVRKRKRGREQKKGTGNNLFLHSQAERPKEDNPLTHNQSLETEGKEGKNRTGTEEQDWNWRTGKEVAQTDKELILSRKRENSQFLSPLSLGWEAQRDFVIAIVEWLEASMKMTSTVSCVPSQVQIRLSLGDQFSKPHSPGAWTEDSAHQMPPHHRH